MKVKKEHGTLSRVITKSPTNTVKETVLLLDRYRYGGDPEARRRLIVGNFRFVKRILSRVSRAQGKNFCTYDFFQIAVMALIRSIEYYENKGIGSFHNYAARAIYVAVRRESFRKSPSLIDRIEMEDYREDSVSRIQERLDVEVLLKRLTQRERTIIVGLFGLEGRDPKTLRSIGIQLRLSSERVRQIKNRALTKMQSDHQERPLL